MEDRPLIAVAVGNTRTRVGRFDGKELRDPVSLPNSSVEDVVKAVMSAAESVHDPVILVSSVNEPVANAVCERLKGAGQVARLGEDLGLPLHHTLDDATTLGQDRALNAIGAFARTGQACVIIDAGTAVTVDFIDGVGTFHGGMIAPGLNMMLRALNEQTAALPKVELAEPSDERGVYGKDTSHAMLLGVLTSVRGLVHAAIDRYAEAYGAYPQVIATGGDAALLFEHDDYVEHIVPDLQLIGIREAFIKAMQDESAE